MPDSDLFQPIILSLMLITLVAGASSALLTLGSSVRSRLLKRAKLAKTRNRQLDSVLATADLAEIGSYLDDVLGKFTVYEYVSDSSVRETLDRYLRTLRSFVGTDDAIARITLVAADVPEVQQVPELTAEMQKIREDLLSWHEPWNALARLRGQIEGALRRIGRDRTAPFNHYSTAAYMIQELERTATISPASSSALNYSISVCNRAIHGQDVPPADALRAFDAAAANLPELAQDQTTQGVD